MAKKDYLPTTDSGLVAFASNMAARLTADPVPYGVTAPIAAELTSLSDDYAAKYAVAVDPPTRNKPSVFAKNQSKANLISYLRQVCQQIQRTISVSDQQREELGLPIRDTDPSAWPVPTDPPSATVKSVKGRTVRLTIRDPQFPDRRSLPELVEGVLVMSYVGETAPEDPTKWALQGPTGRMDIDVVFPNDVAPGSKVWLTCAFYNKRGMGPACSPVPTFVLDAMTLGA